MGDGPMGLPRCSGEPTITSKDITKALTPQRTAIACQCERHGMRRTTTANTAAHTKSVNHAPHSGEPMSHQGIAPIKYRLNGKAAKNRAKPIPTRCSQASAGFCQVRVRAHLTKVRHFSAHQRTKRHLL